ncbi:alkyl hydroperoxide reductase/ Thiol specific antioxidant/ Mal allergen [Thermocrinis albus DSM 14484]|uniref:Alkyl hydroperoxide reductase/ Thiol specific antioxidant/ Mal allergen n=1 Tax=Thermocrinis albus (strain DSM 14484 / JCM 11386 / HI 11/12) TaxID=638303 RepID=D3SPU5_THEAH|nr:TlpA disulfide reductase family protein [Thermocrinis albus]ADC89182.1 alkyl hydroperoxide reductase/ Thiol specific antioxidant/ Mal allergen [Thermocrinis albus DSM 14484]
MKRLWVLFLLFLWACSPKDSLPPVKVLDLKGRQVNLDSFRGRPVILYVWSRTCAGHATQLSLLHELAQRRKDLTVISYAIAMDPAAVSQSYLSLGLKPSFITLVDPEVKISEYYTITFLPSTFFFDERGRLVKIYAGLPYDSFIK